jgi:hypothetical protein
LVELLKRAVVNHNKPTAEDLKEAHASAVNEADSAGFAGAEREAFVRERERQRYAELKKK